MANDEVVVNTGAAIDGRMDVAVFQVELCSHDGSALIRIVAVFRRAGSNAVEVSRSVRSVLPGIKTGLPTSVSIIPVYDRSLTIVDSIGDVQTTLYIAFGLVVMVIFVFLGRATDTLIPAIALPLSLLFTFVAMDVLGYSLDNLSLMALTLAVGFLVDDAIVFLENTVRLMETGMNAFEASIQSAKEISFTILAMTLSPAAVFIPLVFMGGLMGRIFREFSITIVISILASGLVSLTLTPLMTSRLLGNRGKDAKKTWMEQWFGAIEHRILDIYGRSLWFFLRQRWISAPGYAIGPATQFVEKATKEILPPGVQGTLQGVALVFQNTISDLAILMLVAVFVMYVILAILYESYLHPLTVLSSLPVALVGGLLTLWLFGAEASLYAYIGMFMLMGIVKKNGIMIVDFAEARVRQGIPDHEAIHDASIERFRPIMMTTLAALLGAVPIALGYGADGASRRPLGLIVIGGLVVSQFITLFITPAIYLSLEEFQEKALDRIPFFRTERKMPTPAAAMLRETGD